MKQILADGPRGTGKPTNARNRYRRETKVAARTGPGLEGAEHAAGVKAAGLKAQAHDIRMPLALENLV